MTDLIRSACLDSYPSIARSLGLDPLRLLAKAGIDKRCLDDPDIRLPAGAMGRLLEVSAQAAKVEDFGLRLAETRTLSILGPVGLLVREEATVRDALTSLMRYIRLHNESLSLRLDERDGLAIVGVEIRVRGLVPIRQGVELTVGVLYRVLCSLVGPHWKPLVCFAHGAPRRRDTHRRLFAGRVEFGHEFNGIVCDSRDLDRAIPASDPALARYARLHLESLLARPNALLSDKVRELVSLQLSTGRCRVELVAEQLGINRRTLHRKLADEGLTFSALVDSVRTEIVTRALPGRDRPLSLLADMLGFASLSAFSRWFRHCFGASPSAWRRAALNRPRPSSIPPRGSASGGSRRGRSPLA
ncbi:MAG: AraC family transcriptional regulator [Reyranellaceae bacterium]